MCIFSLLTGGKSATRKCQLEKADPKGKGTVPAAEGKCTCNFFEIVFKNKQYVRYSKGIC